MRKLSLTAALLLGSAIATPAFADGHLQIVDEPLDLTIQMNHRAYPVYQEDWPVEQRARALTNIHLKDVTVGANMATDSENTGRTEALNLMLASGNIPDIVGSSRLRDFVTPFGPAQHRGLLRDAPRHRGGRQGGGRPDVLHSLSA